MTSRKHLLLALIASMHSLATPAQAETPTVVDQSLVFPVTGSPAFRGSLNLSDASTGQEFVPTLPELDFFDYFTADLNPDDAMGVTLRVEIRSDSPLGPIVGTSKETSLPNRFEGVTHFRFPSLVPLVPTSRYVAIVSIRSGASDWELTLDNNQLLDDYPRGRLFFSGLPYEQRIGININTDAWFREGLIIPEPSAIRLCVLGAVLAAVRSLVMRMSTRTAKVGNL